MKVKVTKESILIYEQALLQLKKFVKEGKITSIKTMYQIEKALRTISAEAESLRQALEIDPILQEYDAKRRKIIEKYAKKNEDGQVIVNEANMAQFDEGQQELFEKEIEELNEEYKDTLAAHDKKVDEYRSMLMEEDEYDIHYIDVEHIPDDERIAPLVEVLFPILYDKESAEVDAKE